MSFSRIKQLLSQEHGMDLSMYADSFLEKSLEQRMQATACASPDDYCAHLEQNPAEGKTLQASLHIHFSQFFRHPLTFAVLEGVILPELIQRKKQEQRGEIRIWSAGCAAGQEACSLAILLEEALGNIGPGLTYRIFATDLDEGQLAQARDGCYPAAALDNLSLKRTRTWFTPQDEGYRVRPALHQNLDFSTFDLLQQEGGSPPASIFGDFDLILCCNLLIYYRPKTQSAILDRFGGCLARGGILVTGEAEQGLALAHRYRAVYPPAPVFRMNRRKCQKFNDNENGAVGARGYTSPDYLHVHELLTRIRNSSPHCRFLYLMERRPDGGVIFTNDSDPFDSKDHSPPGQTYDEAPAELHAAFAANQPIVRGPYADRWGTWVSAFVPLSDPKSAMLGMDIDARDWKQKVALRAALPAVLAGIAILIGLLAVLLHQSRRKHRARQAELQESEAQKRAILDGINSNIFLVDQHQKILWANRAAANSVHKRTEDLVGHCCYSFWGDSSKPCANCPTVTAFQTGRRDHQIIHTPDGRIWDETGEPIFDADGNVVAVVEIASDITERARNESLLHVSEAKYRRLIENSHHIIYILTAEGVFTFVSPAWTALLGHPVDQVVGQPFQPFVHPDDLPGCTVFLKSVIEKGQPQSGVEYRVRHADGSWRWHTSSAVPLRDESGMVVGLEGTASDVTLQKQATERIRVLLDEANQSRRAMLGIIEDEARSKADLERLAMAINQAAETVEVTDAQGLIQFVNPAFERVTGYSRQEAMGQTPRILKSGKHSAEFYRRMWATLVAGQSWSGHFVNKRKDGTLFEEEATISPVFDRTGKVVNYVAVKRDVTHEVRLQAQLQQAQKMEAVGRLAGGVAHDFNNLLMGIMGYADLCRDVIEPGHPAREYLDEITRASERSAEITRQLLAFARKQTIAPKVLNLNDAVAGMLKLLRRLIGEDIKLAWRPGMDIRPVNLDPSQVDQVLANLCVNARDAIAGVGEIAVETGNTAIDAEYCASHPEAMPGAYVLLAVSDDGCGMDKETLAQVFEPFFTTKGIGKGTGLGLATIYGIVKQNNGFIDVSSEPGKGTTFSIYLPQVESDTLKNPAAATTEAPKGHGETVLLVEDDRSVSGVCGRFLEALDYKVLAAETPGEALHIAARHPGDLHVLLTDVVMPGMDGRQLAKRISAIKPGVKVLFMSGYTADVIAQRGVLDEGMQFISKPFMREDLARKVHEMLKAD